MTNPFPVLEVIRPAGYDQRHPGAARVRNVIDPDIGLVPVRYRIPTPERTARDGHWTWGCPACDLQSTTPDCPHTFAAALDLANELLGLVAAAAPTERKPE